MTPKALENKLQILQQQWMQTKQNEDLGQIYLLLVKLAHIINNQVSDEAAHDAATQIIYGGQNTKGIYLTRPMIITSFWAVMWHKVKPRNKPKRSQRRWNDMTNEWNKLESIYSNEETQ
jgi:hypothetical protein